ncbi:hypothetical protein HDA32_001144 [Spinactinospora alkalitolerans]|uniref:DEAD/DEAH box helicase n=1 Tax=Spinactinospora alkalitolerans TaxID=687207 RepID=A0A852TVA3_9ACTN|nr:DEAD/DEAH box helicase [Spinactinospora alkalitolerans]NYE46024.1 hypothetical protein [Spinactinospora alkalitolerans]
MTVPLDTLATSELITTTYRRYLRSLLPVRDPAIAQALDHQVSTSALLSKGPFLEATPPYLTGATLRQLIDEEVLHPGFARLFSEELPGDRPLYLHQEHAIRKAARGRNLVVATGTGSGKTESFLLPILNELSRQHDAGELGPGVRAILLYPMNALANDQLKRLRLLLKDTPHITFGRYTGDTHERPDRAREEFRSLHPDQPLLENELISRVEMRKTPPHLLLTNYAMLEYLLLRPADLDLFEGEHAGHWRFIALDEAHVYDGAKAAEVAMLLRRLRDRVAPGTALQCIATSATVGDDGEKATAFAQRLFTEPLEWMEGDPDRQDLIGAARRKDAPEHTWGPLAAAEYARIADSGNPEEQLLVAAGRHGRQARSAFSVLAQERRMAAMRTLLENDGPRTLQDVAQRLFYEVPDADPALDETQQVRTVAALVALGSRIHDDEGTPLLSARYHLFARASEGAFTCLSESGPHVALARHEICPDCSAAVFEFGSCQRCGDVYLVGTVRPEEGASLFRPQNGLQERPQWLNLGGEAEIVDDDDDTLEPPQQAVRSMEYHLCVSCGALGKTPVVRCAASCAGKRLRRVWAMRSGNAGVSGCRGCGARSTNIIRRFESGNDAAAAVIATALYQALPEDADTTVADRPGGGRKLLMFSDSRQDAAFFAPYLESTYQKVQHRSLILAGLHAGHTPGNEFWTDDLIEHTTTAAAKAGLFRRRTSRQDRAKQAARWVMRELVATDERQSLEGRGLLRVGMDRPEEAPPASGIGAELGLDAMETWDLLSELVRTLRQQGALTMPENVDPRDEIFAPRLGPVYARESGADRARKVLSWMPTKGDNRRLNYIRRLLKTLGASVEPTTVLQQCWRFLRDTRDGWLVGGRDHRSGLVYQVDFTYLVPEPVTAETRLYRCDRCKRFAPVSVRGVCQTINCEGALVRYTAPAPEQDEDHYRRLYRGLSPVRLRAMEHTAQWSNQRAAEIQQEFIRGDVNALSCSTTFELGVDVGELQSVLLRNMPPTTANYVQRAGRAGRRASSAALAVTYARRRAHDLFRYQDPREMIAGAVRAPFVPLGNERIDRRHAHSVALAAFLRYHSPVETWTTAGAFFLPGEDGSSAPVERVAAYLDSVPDELTEALSRVLEPSVAEEIGLASGQWAKDLCALLEDVRREITEDVQDFERQRVEAFEARRDGLAARFLRTVNTIKNRPLLNYLATKNVLPKYGFPVDTVELRTYFAQEGRDLELARDLTSAIYEYAPGSSVIAGGKRWTSGGVYRLPGRELLSRYYAVCDSCGYYQESSQKIDPVCASCGAQRRGVQKHYCVPEFGFVADSSVGEAGETPPVRSWIGATHVLRLAADPSEFAWPMRDGGTIRCRSGSRGELVAVSEGVGRAGYLICDRCGRGLSGSAHRDPPKEHDHLFRNQTCTGRLAPYSLAHRYQTDLVEVSFDGRLERGAMPETARSSLLYALLEGASSALEISRDDIGGSLYRRAEGETTLVIFDTVPGGAGGSRRIAESFDLVAAEAMRRMRDCDCGYETSCYGCLRNYRNQTVHDRLQRGTALEVLEALIGG